MADSEWDISRQSAIISIIILQCICYAIVTPIVIYYTHKIWKLNIAGEPYIRKRHPKIVVISVILWITYPVIVNPISQYVYFNNPNDTKYLFFGPALSQLWVAFTSVRLWLLYYDYSYELQQLNQRWQSAIIGSSNNYTWTIKYQWLGNSKYVIIIALSYWFICATITALSPGYVASIKF